MKKLQHLLLLSLLALLLCFSTSLQAQDFYDFPELSSHFYQVSARYSAPNLSTVGASAEQISAIEEAKTTYRYQFEALSQDFLYHEDLTAADNQNFAAFEAKVKTILTEQQFAKLPTDQLSYDEALGTGFDLEDWDTAAYIATTTDFFLEEYSFLDISSEQAAKLAQKQADIFVNNQWDDYEALMHDAYSETFSPAQMEKYETYKLEQAAAEEAAATTIEEEDISNDTIAQEDLLLPEDDMEIAGKMDEAERQRLMEEEQQELEGYVKVMQSALELLKTYYVPERANIRAKIEAQLSPADRKTINRLREQYDQYVSNIEVAEDHPPLDYMGRTRDDAYIEMDKINAEVELLDTKELLGFGKDGNTNSLGAFLQSERSIFYTAKELAVRYDRLLDDYAKENDLLTISWLIQLIPSMPTSEGMPANYEEVMRKTFLKEVYQTKEVEYRRNITFLLSKPGEYDPSALQSNRVLHEVSVFPVPASEQQTVSFSLANDGMVTVEVVSQDGKLLKTVHSGTMQKGTRQLHVNVRDIPATAFFYRISDAQGTSLVKALRTE